MLSKENFPENAQLVMDKDITFPNIQELLYLAGIDHYFQDKVEDLTEDEIDNIIEQLESNWKILDSHLVDYDIHKGYTVEAFVIKDLANNKDYIVELVWLDEEGYDLAYNLEWKEAEQTSENITYYKPKNNKIYTCYIRTLSDETKEYMAAINRNGIYKVEDGSN